MRNLSLDVVARWTSSNVGCDLSGFAIPTTDTAPWGEPGHVVRIELHVDPGNAEPDIQRTVLDGTWDRSKHALVIPAPTRRDPDRIGACGLSGLVRVTLQDGWLERRNGFAVHGRCLLEDEARLMAIMTATAAAEIERLAASYSSLLERLPAVQAQEPALRR